MKEVYGDLIQLAIDGEFDAIIHQCNCYCTFGAGIAKQIKDKIPEAYKVDCTTKKGDPSKLGYYTTYFNGQFYVINLYSQFSIGGLATDYIALRVGLKRIKKDFNGLKIAYPKIGAGLGGGDWNIISEIIDEELKDEDHTLVIYKQ